MFTIERRTTNLAAGLLALAASLAPAAAREPRIVVRLDHPCEIAGRAFPPGEISVREVDAYNPVATLTEVQFNGESIGLFLTRRSAGAPPAIADELTFARGHQGQLVLIEIARRGKPARSLAAVGDAPAPPSVPATLVAAR